MSNYMQKFLQNRKYLIVEAVIAVMVIMGVILIYIRQLNNTVSATTIANIEELASHDIQTIENYLDIMWSELDGIASRLELHDCDTMEKAQEILYLERTSGNFERIYLVDENGRLYSDAYTVSEYGDAAVRLQGRESGRR